MSSKRFQLRIYVTPSNLLYPIMAKLGTDQERREAILGLATAQALQQLNLLDVNMTRHLGVEAQPEEAVAAPDRASASRLKTAGPAAAADAQPAAAPAESTASYLDPSVAFDFG